MAFDSARGSTSSGTAPAGERRIGFHRLSNVKHEQRQRGTAGRIMPTGFNPYQPPAMLESPLEEVPLSTLEARQRLQLPAYGQIMAGVFGILFCLFLLWAVIVANPHESSTFGGLVKELLVPVLLVCSLAGINVVVILGGRAMLAVRHYRLARWS